MIRINLLPYKRRKKDQIVPPVLIEAGLILFIAIFVLGGITVYLSKRVREKETVKEAKGKELAVLKVKLQKVINYERDNEEFKRKSEIIKQLRENQDIPLKLLDQVSARLSDGVWITNLTNRGMGVDISGFAFTNSDLVRYVQNLKKSESLTGVTLLESRHTNFENVSVYSFRLTFELKVGNGD